MLQSRRDIFISYSSSDQIVARSVQEAIEVSGMTCWMAPRDIAPGADWAESIVNALAGARLVVLIFSQRANESQQIKREVAQAVNEAIPVIPVRIEKIERTRTMSYFLGVIHWFDAFPPPPLETKIPRLIASIRNTLEALALSRSELSPSEQSTGDKPVTNLSSLIPLLAGYSKKQPDTLVDSGRLIRAFVLSALPKMTGSEKAILINSLYAAGLICKEGTIVDLSGADLSGADLRDLSLPGINLFNTNLDRADLRNADLSNGSLMWASIRQIHLDGANLRNVDIVGNEMEDAGLDLGFLRSLGADVRRPD